LGELNLLRPYVRSGKFKTKLFENYLRIDKALASMIVESYPKVHNGSRFISMAVMILEKRVKWSFKIS